MRKYCILLCSILISILIFTGCRGGYGFDGVDTSSFKKFSYEIKVSDVEAENALIVSRYANKAWSPTDKALVMNMQGEVKSIDIYKYYPMICKPENLIALSDQYMQDKHKQIDKKMTWSPKQVKKDIKRLEGSTLEFTDGSDGTCDAGTKTYYLIIGPKDNREIIPIRETGDHTCIPLDSNVIDICKYMDHNL